MKKSRLAVTAALSASVLAGSMLLASPALAADIYVPDATKGVEGDSYPAGWFTGNPQPTTAPVDDETGITLTGMTQFLYGGNISIDSGSAFDALVAGSAVDVDGDAHFQYPIFFNSADSGDLGFTTLRPVDAGTPTFDGAWYSSQAVTIDGEPILAQGEHTFAEVAQAFNDAVAVNATPTVLAVGIYVSEGDTALVRSISFGGDSYFFTEEPEAPVDPTPEPEDPTTPEPEDPTESGDDDSAGSGDAGPADDAAPVATPISTEATFTG